MELREKEGLVRPALFLNIFLPFEYLPSNKICMLPPTFHDVLRITRMTTVRNGTTQSFPSKGMLTGEAKKAIIIILIIQL